MHKHMNDSQKNMEAYWAKISRTYGGAADLEQQIRDLVSRFADSLPHPLSIFELGCGNGKVLKNLEKPGRRIGGGDSSQEMIAAARAALSPEVELACESLDESLARGQSWDLVLCCNTLHNLKDTDAIAAAIAGIGKIVSPSGFAIIDVRNIFNPFIRRGYRKSRSQGMQFFPFSFLRARRIFRRSGFEIVRTVPIFYRTVDEAGHSGKPAWFRVAYGIWLLLTRTIFFAPYIVIIAKKIR